MGNNINEKIVIMCKDTEKITVPECCVEISLECNCTMGKRREIKKFIVQTAMLYKYFQL